MSLNIKSARVHALAREAARITGKTQTGAIEEALVTLLQKYGNDPAETERERRIARMLEIGDRWAHRPDIGFSDAVTEVEDLYDPETGLPS